MNRFSSDQRVSSLTKTRIRDFTEDTPNLSPSLDSGTFFVKNFLYKIRDLPDRPDPTVTPWIPCYKFRREGESQHAHVTVLDVFGLSRS